MKDPNRRAGSKPQLNHSESLETESLEVKQSDLYLVQFYSTFIIDDCQENKWIDIPCEMITTFKRLITKQIDTPKTIRPG